MTHSYPEDWDGTVYGIRPHNPMTEEDAELQRRMAEALPITDPWVLAMLRTYRRSDTEE